MWLCKLHGYVRKLNMIPEPFRSLYGSSGSLTVAPPAEHNGYNSGLICSLCKCGNDQKPMEHSSLAVALTCSCNSFSDLAARFPFCHITFEQCAIDEPDVILGVFRNIMAKSFNAFLHRELSMDPKVLADRIILRIFEEELRSLRKLRSDIVSSSTPIWKKIDRLIACGEPLLAVFREE